MARAGLMSLGLGVRRVVTERSIPGIRVATVEIKKTISNHKVKKRNHTEIKKEGIGIEEINMQDACANVIKRVKDISKEIVKLELYKVDDGQYGNNIRNRT